MRPVRKLCQFLIGLYPWYLFVLLLWSRDMYITHKYNSSGMMNNACSSGGICRITLVSNDTGNIDGIVTKPNRTYPWSSVNWSFVDNCCSSSHYFFGHCLSYDLQFWLSSFGILDLQFWLLSFGILDLQFWLPTFGILDLQFWLPSFGILQLAVIQTDTMDTSQSKTDTIFLRVSFNSMRCLSFNGY
jgi:hypothetical protein